MDDVGIYLLRSSCCLALLYLIYVPVFGRVNRPGLRRAVLMLSVVLSLVLPSVNVTLVRKVPVALPDMESGIAARYGEPVQPSDDARLQLSVNPETGVRNVTLAGPEAAAREAGRTHRTEFLKTVPAILYFTGIAVFIVLNILSVVSLHKLDTGKCRLLRLGKVRLYVLPEDIAPMSWFGRVYIGRKDFTRNLRPVLMHELEHVRRYHSADLLAVNMVAAFQWFNPFVWLLRRELVSVHEYEVDRSMIERNIDVIRYVQLLLVKATGFAPGLANGFHHSIIKNRITMITRKKSSGKTALFALYLVPFVCLGTVAFAQWKTVPVLPESGIVNIAAPTGTELSSVSDTLEDMTGMTVKGEKVISDQIIRFSTKGGEKALVFLPRAEENASSETELLVLHGQYKPGRSVDETCTVETLAETLAATDSMRNIAVFCYPETSMGLLKDVTDVLRKTFPDCSLTIQRNMERHVTRAFVDDVSGIGQESSGNSDLQASFNRDELVIVRCNQDNMFFVGFGNSQHITGKPEEVIEFSEKCLAAAPDAYRMVSFHCDRATSFGPMDEVVTWFKGTGLQLTFAPMKDHAASLRQ